MLQYITVAPVASFIFAITIACSILAFSNNNMAYIQRVQPTTGYVFPGKDKSLNLMVPIRVGYELKIYNSFGEPFIGINLSYIMNVTWGEGLDGYGDSSDDFKNNTPDLYRQISLGIKVNFGPSR